MQLQNLLYTVAVFGLAAGTTLSLVAIFGPIGAAEAAAKATAPSLTTQLHTTDLNKRPALDLQAGIRMTCGRGGKCA